MKIFHLFCKAIVSVYCSVYLPFLLSKKILSYSLCFIKFLLSCTLRLIILFLRFLFYLAVLYLLSVFLASNMSFCGNVFDIIISSIVNNDFNYFRSLLIFSNNLVHVNVHVNIGKKLNSKFYDHNFQSKAESNSKLENLFSVFNLMFYHSFSKPNSELCIKIFKFLILISVFNVMKYFYHLQAYDSTKVCSQLHLFSYESMNTCDNVKSLHLYSDLVFSSISKLQYRNWNFYFHLLLLLSGDTRLNPGPLHNNQLQLQSEWSVFSSMRASFYLPQRLKIEW